MSVTVFIDSIILTLNIYHFYEILNIINKFKRNKLEERTMLDEFETEYVESILELVSERYSDVLYNGGCSESEDLMDYVCISEVVRHG